jgi:hypothetical protein
MGVLMDDISRVIASPVSRRQAFKMVSGAVGGALLASLGLGRATRMLAADGAGDHRCPRFWVSCHGKCYPPGYRCCGRSVCDRDQICCSNDHCCDDAKTCCGSGCCNRHSTCCGHNTCCQKDVACCNGKCCSSPRAICCGGQCCPEGHLCCAGRCVKKRPSPSTVCRPV